MSDTAKTAGAQEKSDLRIPGFAQLQRLGKSLMLPIAVLPAAGILLRLGQDDLLGKIKAPVIGPFFHAMSAAGDAIFSNLPLLFAAGVAIGFARKADGSTALAAAVGYLVVQAVFKTMSPIVLAGQVDKAGAQAQINYSVFGGILIGLITAWLLTRQQFHGKRMFEFGTMLSFAIPGTVIGVSYIIAFNVPPIELTGTAAILVICFVFRNMPVGVRSGIASLSQIDKSLDEASLTLGANSGRTLRRVILPLLRPAITAALALALAAGIALAADLAKGYQP